MEFKFRRLVDIQMAGVSNAISYFLIWRFRVIIVFSNIERATYDVHKIRLNCDQFIVQNINSDCHNFGQRDSITLCCLLQSTTKQLLVRYRVIYTALIPVGPTVTLFNTHSMYGLVLVWGWKTYTGTGVWICFLRYIQCPFVMFKHLQGCLYENSL